MKYVRTFVLLLALCSQAAAQWQVPNNSVAIGRGQGATGFKNAVPGALGNVLRSTGPSTPPAFAPPLWAANSVTFTQNGTGAVQILLDALLRGNVFTPEMYGGACGVADNGPAIQLAVNAAGGVSPPGVVVRGSVRLAPCVYDTVTPVIDTAGITISGGNFLGTQIRFSPVGNNQIAYRVRKAGSIVSGCGINNIVFFAPNNTFTQTAIEVEDVSQCAIENVYVYGATLVPGIGGFWSGGTGSAALRTKGREFIRVNKFTAFADRPLVVADNPNSTLDIDVSDFNDLSLVANGFPGLQIDDGVIYSRFNVSNIHCAVVTHCVYNNDTTGTILSVGMTIHNLGSEQNTLGGAGYTVYVSHSGSSFVQTLTLSGYQIWDNFTNGIFLRNVTNVSLAGVFYQGFAPLQCLNTDATARSLSWTDSNFQVCSTSSFLGQNKVWSTAPVPGVALPRSAVWMSTTESPTLSLTNVIFAPFTVGALAPCDLTIRGLRSFVTDNNTALSFGAVITTGGNIATPVWCDGTAGIWRQG